MWFTLWPARCLYTATHRTVAGLRQPRTGPRIDTPLSKSHVSLRLEDIQKRCADLINGTAEETDELTLADESPETTDDQDRYCIER